LAAPPDAANLTWISWQRLDQLLMLMHLQLDGLVSEAADSAEIRDWLQIATASPPGAESSATRQATSASTPAFDHWVAEPAELAQLAGQQPEHNRVRCRPLSSAYASAIGPRERTRSAQRGAHRHGAEKASPAGRGLVDVHSGLPRRMGDLDRIRAGGRPRPHPRRPGARRVPVPSLVG